MKILFFIVVVVHGLIHLLGFVKAYNLAIVSQLSKSISRSNGILWLVTAILFISSSVLFFINKDSWWILSLIAILFSQYLIFTIWRHAKFGTITNLIILAPVIVLFMNSLPSGFQNRYKSGVEERLQPVSGISILRQEDIQHLPVPVQKYLIYVGAIGKPKIQNFKAVFHGTMKRKREGNWLDVTAQQYDFINDYARLFYIESSLFGIPFDGLHMYIGNKATMQIKVAGVFQVADAKGEMMNQGETVTLFNDMCLMAPATLIDKTIKWEYVDSLNVKARFSNKGNSIAAILSFNEKGELINFTSDDRYLSSDGKNYTKYPWSTPVRDYKDFEGRKIPVYAEAIWTTPEGPYLYAKFNLVDIEYNCKEFKRSDKL